MLQQRTIIGLKNGSTFVYKINVFWERYIDRANKHFCGILIKATVWKVLDPLNPRVSCTVCCRESLIRVLESEMKIVHEI